MTKPLLILGSGSFAIEVLDIAETAGGFRPLGFANSLERPAPGSVHAGLPVFWADDIPYSPDDCVLAAGIVTVHRRAFVETMVSRGYTFVSVIHPSAVISHRARTDAGCVVNAGVVVGSNAVIGPHAILNRGSLIGHDCHIGRFCTVGPGANLAGGVEVGDAAYIGAGAVVRDHLTIGAESVVGAGAVVVKSVSGNVMVTGVPATVMRTGVRGL